MKKGKLSINILFFLLLNLFILNELSLASQSLYCRLADKNSFFYQHYCTERVVFTAPATATSIAPTGRASDTVMRQLVVPTERPKAYAKVLNVKRAAGPVIRYENIDLDKNHSDEGADIYGTTLVFAQDMDNLSFGIFVPYDYMLFNDSAVDDIQQIGSILFAQYRISLAEEKYMLTLTANIDYFFASVDLEDDKDDDDVNSVGGGIGASFKVLKWDSFIPTLGISYQYQNDDTEVNDHHLFRAGMNLAWLPTPKWAVNAFGIWDADLTDYDPGDNDEYWDIGMEVNFQATDTWSLNLGYKKVVGLEDFDSDQVYLGALWRF